MCKSHSRIRFEFQGGFEMSKLQMRRLRIKFALGCESKRVIQSNRKEHWSKIILMIGIMTTMMMAEGRSRWGSGWQVGAKAGETFWIPQQTRIIIYCVMNAANAGAR